MKLVKHIVKNRSGYYIVFLCIVALLVSTRGIIDEGNVSMDGDMPRYMMNGVYFYDLLSDMPVKNPLRHAYQYFAQYPALSLGHHPILLGLFEVPFFYIFGVSVFPARLTIAFFSLIAVWAWFLLVRSIYDENTAFFSSLLFATSPFIVSMSRIVMPEIPTLALIILGTYLFYQYTETEKKKYAYSSVLVLALSVYSKQISIFMFVVLGCYLLIKRGPGSLIQKIRNDPRILISKELAIFYIVTAVMVLLLVPMTMKYSRVNLEWVFEKGLSDRISSANILFYIKKMYTHYLSAPIFVLSVISLFLTVWQRDKRSILFILWIAICYLFFTVLGTHNTRFAFYWIPPLCLMAVTIIYISERRIWRIIVMAAFIIIAGYQIIYAYNVVPEYARGYENAAKYVAENRKGECIMYSGVTDTGYFVFFVRKHDPDRELIVLRADKILATSAMSLIVEEHIQKQEEIYKVLNDYGVRYVVIEDTFTNSRVLEWLRFEVKSGRFDLRDKTILQSSDARVNNVPLSVYEYRDYTPPKEGIKLNLNIVLMNEVIEVLLDDLLKKGR